MAATIISNGSFIRLFDEEPPKFIVPTCILLDYNTGLPLGAGDFGGSAYTEDAVAPADPAGNSLALVRKDTPAALTTTDGDIVIARGSNFGSLYVTGLDINGTIWDLLTEPTVRAAIDKMLPASPWYYVAPASGYTNTTTAVTIKTADATLRHYVSSIQISSEALTAGGEYGIRDGAAGAFLWRTKIGTAGLLGGREINFNPPLRGTAATLLEFVGLTASIAGAVYFNAQGFSAT